MVMAWPLRPSRSASAVPQAPAPITAVRITTLSSCTSTLAEAVLLAATETSDVGAVRPEHEERDHHAHQKERRPRALGDQQQPGKEHGGDEAAERDVSRGEDDADEGEE